MSILQKVLLFAVLPLIAVLFYPPSMLGGAGGLLVFVVVAFAVIGFFLWRGSPQLLTFVIFIQGMNAIVRLMLFFSHAVSKQQVLDLPFAVTCLLGLGLSIYLVLRLDKSDVRITMVRI